MLKIYRITMKKWSVNNPRGYIVSDLEAFDKEILQKDIDALKEMGYWAIGEFEMEATPNQIETGKYLGLIK